MKRGVAFVCVSALLAAFLAVRVPLTVYAEKIGGYYQYGDPAQDVTITGVYQGDSSTDFVKVAPIATIYIDEAMIDTTMRRNAAKSDLILNSDPRAAGLRLGPVMRGATEDFGLNAGDNFLIFDNRRVPDTYKIKSGQDNFIPGDLAYFKFEDAAETQGGELCDVVFTYSNLHIVLQSTDEGTAQDQKKILPEKEKALESFAIAGGNLIQVAGTQRLNPSDAKAVPSLYGQAQRYGIKVDVNVQVLKKNGTPAPGNFYFRIVDIDVPRDGNGFKSLYESNVYNNNNYSEHIQLLNGFEASPHKVYVPGGKEDASQNTRSNTEPGYKCKIIEDGSGGYMFIPTKPDYYPDADGSFYSGFLTVVDNSTGVNLSAWSAGAGDATVRTKLLAGFRTNTNIVYNVVSSTSPGGNIQTTTKGNLDGDSTTLDADEQVINPSKLMVSSGKSVSYTLIPENKDHCYPKEVIVDGVPYKGTELETLLGGPVAKGVERYTFSGFSNIDRDHTIHVNWYHDPRYGELYRYSNRMNLPPEVLKTIPPNSALDKYYDGDMVSASAPSQTSLTIDGFIYTFNGWQESNLTVAGADVEFVGSWTITPVPVPVAATPPPADPGTSAFVPPPAPVEEAEEEEEVVEITEEEMLAAQLAVQKKMLSPETGDDAPVAALVFVMLLSGSVCLLAARRKRRLK